METTERKMKFDGKVRSCRLSHNRRMYFIRTPRMIRATIYDCGPWHIGMFIIGSRRRHLQEAGQQS